MPQWGKVFFLKKKMWQKSEIWLDIESVVNISALGGKREVVGIATKEKTMIVTLFPEA